MSWFGPKSCNCGCDFIAPDCACPDEGCFPAGRAQFSSIKVEIEWDDEITLLEKYIARDCTAPCFNQVYEETFTHTLSGMSQVNGTYDIGYYVKNSSDEWVPGNTKTDPCGWWFFPRIPITLTRFEERYRYYPGGCKSPVTTTEYNGTQTPLLNVATGTFQAVGFGWEVRENYGLGINRAITGTAYGDRHQCSHPGSTQVSSATSYTMATRFQASGVPSIISIINPVVYPVDFNTGNQAATIDGQDGLMYPYHKVSFGFLTPIERCMLRYQQATHVLNSKFASITGGNTSCSGGTIYQPYQEYSLGGFTSRVKYILNA